MWRRRHLYNHILFYIIAISSTSLATYPSPSSSLSSSSSSPSAAEIPYSDRVYQLDGRIYRYVGRAAPPVSLPVDGGHALPVSSEDEDYIKPEDIYVRPESTSPPTPTTTLKPIVDGDDFLPESKIIPEKMLIAMGAIKDATELSTFLEAGEVGNESNDTYGISPEDDIKLSYLFDGNGFRDGEPRGHGLSVPKLTAPAGCTPELHSYEIDRTDRGLDIYFPWCIKLPRCSGCCSSRRLVCQPISVSTVNITVLRLSYQMASKKFKLAGLETIAGQKHEKCRCMCLQTAKDCNSRQLYRSDECRCVCKNFSQVSECQKQPDQSWDSTSCECKQWTGRTKTRRTGVNPRTTTTTTPSTTTRKGWVLKSTNQDSIEYPDVDNDPEIRSEVQPPETTTTTAATQAGCDELPEDA